MISIVRIKNGDSEHSAQPTAWILAHNIHHARELATEAGERELAIQLFQVPDTVRPGSYEISEGLWLLAT